MCSYMYVQQSRFVISWIMCFIFIIPFFICIFSKFSEKKNWISPPKRFIILFCWKCSAHLSSGSGSIAFTIVLTILLQAVCCGVAVMMMKNMVNRLAQSTSYPFPYILLKSTFEYSQSFRKFYSILIRM